MLVIYKYPLTITDTQTLDCPKGAKALHVGLDPQGQPCLWALIDTSNSLGELKVYIVGTGNQMPRGAAQATHIGSFVQGPFVWHVFCQ